MRRVLVGVLITVALVAGPPTASAATKAVTVDDDFFGPSAATLASPGDSVSWRNVGDKLHSTTGRLAVYRWTKDLSTGGTFAKSFFAAGGYPYFCRFHSGMTGTVIVPIRTSAASGALGTTFTLRWASVTAPSGYRYVIRYRKSTTTTWSVFRSGTTAATGTFKPTSRGTYYFRAMLQRWSGSNWLSSAWSPLRSIVVS